MSTTAVRVHDLTKATLDVLEKRINKARKDKKKLPLTKMQVIALAIENLTIEAGVEK